MSKVLTVSQPYAFLIAAGIKPIENRTWKTNYRGKILIHASAKWHKRGRLTEQLFTYDQFQSLPDAIKQKMIGQGGFQYGAIIGEVEIIDCVINHPNIWAEKTDGVTDSNTNEFIPKSNQPIIYNWVLKNPILYPKPITGIKGKLQLWNFHLCDNCKTPTKEIFECELCGGDVCANCQASYNIHTQIDYNCCSGCDHKQRD